MLRASFLLALASLAAEVDAQDAESCCDAPYAIGFSVDALSGEEPHLGILDAGSECLASGGRVASAGAARLYVSVVVSDPEASVQGAAFAIEATGEIDVADARWLIRRSFGGEAGAGETAPDGGASIGFWFVDPVDPEESDGRRGMILAYVEGNYPTVTEVTTAVAELVVVPRDGITGAGALRFTDGLVGRGLPVRNVLTDRGQTVEICNADQASVQVEITPAEFVRGDCNGDGRLQISDATCRLLWLFYGFGPPPCRAAEDANGDGQVDLSDVVSILAHLFLGAPPPPAPYPECGPGGLPSDAALGCEETSPACA